MVIKLLQKDILLIKRHIVFLILLATIIPVFFSNADELNYNFVFILTTIITILSAYQDISIEEEKYPNATMLLCTLPISRELMVFAKYLLVFFLYVVCIFVYLLVCILLGKDIYFNFNIISQNLLILLLILGLCIPLQYRFGHSVVKYVFSIICVSMPFLVSFLSKANLNSNGPSIWFDLIIFIFSFVIYIISFKVSCFIFNKRDI